MPTCRSAEAIPREMISYVPCYCVQKVRARGGPRWKGIQGVDWVSIIFNRSSYPFSSKDTSGASGETRGGSSPPGKKQQFHSNERRGLGPPTPSFFQPNKVKGSVQPITHFGSSMPTCPSKITPRVRRTGNRQGQSTSAP